MDNKNGNINAKPHFVGDPSEMRKAPGYEHSVPGVNTPEIAPPRTDTAGIELPDYNPPVPNRAWTEMKKKYNGGIPDTQI